MLNLLILYAGLLGINSALSAWFWASTRERLYRLVNLPRVGDHRLRLRFGKGVTGYAFTFG